VFLNLHSDGQSSSTAHQRMACTLLNRAPMLSLLILILLSLHSHSAFSNDTQDDEDDQYVVDSPLANLRSRSRFLATVIKKGMRCDPIAHNVCNGISANNGASLLRCCKTHCRNVLGDKNNCGQCGNKCKQGQRCCSGTCVDTAHNVKHCGECNKKCARGHKCEFGYCGYA
jgi:hypothetical protein